MNNHPLLELKDLCVHYKVNAGVGRSKVLKAVNGINLTLNAGECLGLVGESGCGKSSLASAVMGLVPITSGEIIIDGQSIAHLQGGKQSRLAHARNVQMVFQDPFSSLNPRLTIGQILSSPLRLHGLKDEREIQTKVAHMLSLVGMKPDAAKRRPHEFSGGQRQRICIARALIIQPKILVCDEPVSALDVSIRAQIINLLLELKDELGIALLMISHDLGVVEHMSDNIAVMYLGRLVETGLWSDIFAKPAHPYTQALIASIPDPLSPDSMTQGLMTGEAPSALNPPLGCAFNPRCHQVMDGCRVGDVPKFTQLTGVHQARCHLL